MDDPLPLDVIARLNQDFGDRAYAVSALLVAGRRIGSEDYLDDRLVRCIVYAACGDERRIQQLMEIERRDYRDVIVAGEYDGAMRQVRDLRDSFLIDSPEKFWVGTMTCMMASRGYRLTQLETRSASSGPFKYTSDLSEGRAIFMGPKGEIEMEKKDRQWMLHSTPGELSIHGLNHAFNDECAFRDAVSGYLLSNVAVHDANYEVSKTPAEGMRRRWWRFWK